MQVKLEIVLDVGDAGLEDAKAYLSDRRGQLPPGGDRELGLVEEAALDLFESALAGSSLEWWEVDRSRVRCIPAEQAT